MPKKSPELLPAPKKSSELALSLEKSPRNRFLDVRNRFLGDFSVILPVTMPSPTTILEFDVGAEKVAGVVPGVGKIARVIAGVKKVVRIGIVASKIIRKITKKVVFSSRNWFLHQESGFFIKELILLHNNNKDYENKTKMIYTENN